MALFSKAASSTDAQNHGSREALSVIGVGVRVMGDIASSGVLKIEGTLEGSVRGARQLLLGRNGSIRGDVEAEDVVLGGTVHGSVTASGRVEVQSSSTVNGDIRAKTLVVAEGGRINGTVRTANADGAHSTPSRLQLASVAAH